jgi:predicted Zn-dependent protease
VRYSILLITSLLPACTLYAGGGDYVAAEVERPQTLVPVQCPVSVQEHEPSDEDPWTAPVVSAWPKNLIPVVDIPTDRPYCTIQTIQPALDFWCENLGVCMQARYIDTLPPESEFKPGRVYITIEEAPDPNAAGQAFWWPDSTCHENTFARVYIETCNPRLWIHELGHTLGFGHSSDANDVMFPASGKQISPYAVAAYKLAQLPSRE